jgi:hypothetical protein
MFSAASFRRHLLSMIPCTWGFVVVLGYKFWHGDTFLTLHITLHSKFKFCWQASNHVQDCVPKFVHANHTVVNKNSNFVRMYNSTCSSDALCSEQWAISFEASWAAVGLARKQVGWELPFHVTSVIVTWIKMDFTYLAETDSRIKLLSIIFVSFTFYVRWQTNSVPHFPVSSTFLILSFLISYKAFPVQLVSSYKEIRGSLQTGRASQPPSTPCYCKLLIHMFSGHTVLEGCGNSVLLHARSSDRYLLLRIPFLWGMTLYQWVLRFRFLKQHIVIIGGWNVLHCLVTYFYLSSLSLWAVKSEGIRWVGHVAYLGKW